MPDRQQREYCSTGFSTAGQTNPLCYGQRRPPARRSTAREVPANAHIRRTGTTTSTDQRMLIRDGDEYTDEELDRRRWSWNSRRSAQSRPRRCAEPCWTKPGPRPKREDGMYDGDARRRGDPGPYDGAWEPPERGRRSDEPGLPDTEPQLLAAARRTWLDPLDGVHWAKPPTTARGIRNGLAQARRCAGQHARQTGSA